MRAAPAEKQTFLRPLTKDDVITLMVPSSAATPVLDDWKLWEYMEEGSGATLDVISVPGTDMNTKYSLLFATRDELPDMMHLLKILRI